MTSNIVFLENKLVPNLSPLLLPIPIPTISSLPLHTTPLPTLSALDSAMTLPSSTFQITTEPRMLKTTFLLVPHSFVTAQSTSTPNPILTPHTLKVAPYTHSKITLSSITMYLHTTPTPHTSNFITAQPSSIHHPTPNQQPT